MSVATRVLAEPSLTLKRRLKAAPAQVYAAWTDPAKIVKWFGPDAGPVEHAELDVRVGGRYSLGFRTEDGEQHQVSGVYREVVPNERLSFTWAWRTMPERESLVTILIKPDGAGSLLTLIHEKFFDEPARDRHRDGWSGCLDKLERYLDGIELEGPRFESGRPMTMAGLSEHYSFETRHRIPEQWRRFGPLIGEIPNRIGQDLFGVVSIDDRGFNYMTGARVSDFSKLPPRFARIGVPARRYAVFIHRGPVSTVTETFDAIWHSWLPNSGFELDGAPEITEVYGKTFDAKTGLGSFEIWVAIKNVKSTVIRRSPNRQEH
ncbi:MAG TPA: SRPBCC domain-containing protein [Methyloceanibacter sp.]|nr:SRPBCC domain-containing protein [Methyloceanibacter sp.]